MKAKILSCSTLLNKGLTVGLTLGVFSCASLDRVPAYLQEHHVTPGQALTEADMALDSIEGIMARTYAVISGPKGEPRDWARFHDLFLPGQGTLKAVYRNRDDEPMIRAITPEEYASMAQGMFDQEGFFETGLYHRIERFGSIAHVFSTYESRRDPAAEPFARGINSCQLFWDGTRWYVVSIFWDQEYPNQTIPPRYLPR